MSARRDVALVEAARQHPRFGQSMNNLGIDCVNTCGNPYIVNH